MQDCISIQISQGVQIDNLFIHGNNNQLFLDTKVDIFDVEIIGDGNVIKAQNEKKELTNEILEINVQGN